MPGCAAVGCNNRSEKGYIMKCFPRDPKLRKIWEERVARADWKASNNSFLCHMHFEPQEWSVTKSGRIRLRKNAVPSIFTITSTRKSAKKRIKLPIAQKNNKFQYTVIEYLEKRIDRDSDFRDSDEFSSDSMDDCLYSDIMELKNEGNSAKLHVKKDPDMDDNVIIISDDDSHQAVERINLQEKSNDSNNALKPLLSPKTADHVQTSKTIVKEEVKSEIIEHVILDDSYDEIEEKLKQICDGGCTQDDNYTKENNVNSIEKDKRIASATSEMSNNNTVISDVESNDFKKKCGSDDTTNKRGNVEIIFGAESGEEKRDLSHSTWNKDSIVKLDKTNDSTVSFNETVNIKEEKKVFTEDIEENFARDEVHVIPNMRAAMKRKRRTREEIMKSIKKSIKSTSDQDGNSSSSGLTIVTDPESELGDDLSRSPCQIKNTTSENAIDTAKFIIKVTGDPSDVEEIMDELTSNTITKSPPQKLVVPHTDSQNAELVTSVVTIYSSLSSSKEFNDSDTNVNSSKNVCATPNRTSSNEPTNSGSSIHHPSFCRHSLTSLDDEDRNVTENSNTCKQCCLHRQTSDVAGSSSCVSPAESDKLMMRIRLQEEVIKKLTDQIILYKEFENNIRGKNPMRIPKDIDISTHKMNTRSSTAQLASSVKRSLEWKQKLIEDLSNRVNYLEELNKKLMKTVTIESQQRRHLEGQLKQKDNRIKELNWKLEKASKYLERAEKNTNTYRRKMLNMQTIIRRKKVVDEKVCKFNEILTDTTRKQDYSEKDYAMAVEIRKSCGKVGYEKLVSYGFPLPPLSGLQRRLSADDATDYDSTEDKSLELSKENSKIETVKNPSSENMIDSKFSDLASKEVDFDGAETVTGTVQDIFDENNDGDDFSTNELREHFILQLNAVM